MKNKFQETLRLMEVHRDENFKKLISLKLDKLYDMQKYYYNWYKGAEESGYTESAVVNKKHHDLILEAIKIVEGNKKSS
ncbi:MAG: hypothetical protein ABI723_14840 [Bacteroidia bacterium]